MHTFNPSTQEGGKEAGAGLHSECQNSQVYVERPWLKKTKKKKQNKTNQQTNEKQQQKTKSKKHKPSTLFLIEGQQR